jgi:deoxyribodipyrimidine photo-lyase
MIYGIFIFRRDLRLNDNHGLINLMKKCDKVIPVFFLDKYQIIKSNHNEHYFSNNVVQFLCESLSDLNNQLKKYDSKLFYFFGEPNKLLENIIKQLNNHKLIVGYNADFSSYSLKRDKNIDDTCKLYDIEVIKTNTDYTLIPFENLIKSNGEAFKQYSAFYKNAIKYPVTQVINNNNNNYVNDKFKLLEQYNKSLDEFYEKNEANSKRWRQLKTS